ncbi:MAG: hypothetical protein H7326_11465 [Bdellovibrionaceae bacterium]|nr:hypothetical protein [Pseudobdellovibrionaceae bacterium]
MKLTMSVLVALFAIPAISSAANPVLDCSAKLNQDQPPYSFEAVQVRGEYVSGWFKNIVVKVVSTDYNDQKVVQTGRAAELDPDEKYAPRKYANHNRFNLDALTETKNFAKFYPADSCRLELLVPQDVQKAVTDGAPLLIHCDQSGGVVNLKCTLN